MTDNVSSIIHTKSRTGKEIKIPGPDHPITISPAEGKVRVTVAGRIVAESAQALGSTRRDMRLFITCRATTQTYPCSFGPRITPIVRTRVIARTTAFPLGGSKSEYAVWTYEKPYEAVASIKEYLAFYPSRIDAIEMIS